MLLKRDTDVALRVLFCLKQNCERNDAEGSRGLTLAEIAKRTGVPKLTAGRICDCLLARGMIHQSLEQNQSEKIYYSTKELGSFSLLDVVKATERTVQIFGLFDRNSNMYKHCRDRIMDTQKIIENLLSKTTLDSFFE